VSAQVLSFRRGRLVSRRLPGVPSAAVVEALLRRPEVRWIGPAPAPRLLAEDEGTSQVVAGNLDRGGAQPMPVLGYAGWLGGLGITGAGVRVSVVDTGVDASHGDLDGRVIQRVSYNADGSAIGGHGTHVAGIVAGDGATGFADTDDFLYGLGVAPQARILDQAALAGEFPPEDKNFEV
jgi:subtilisin family serine protease